MLDTARFSQLEITSAAQLHDWFVQNSRQSESVWLRTFKKNTGSNYVSTEEVLDELICFGWVDGLRRKLDENQTLRLISPRRTQIWAKTYRDRAARLVTQWRMQPSGFEAIELSKRLKLWIASAEVDALVMPPDLQKALSINSLARDNFMGFAVSHRRNVLRWLATAKQDKTRKLRIEKIVRHALFKIKLPQL
jgi:uncharacterized protein YdeI (YjbR/CyaY-like superfamily)